MYKKSWNVANYYFVVINSQKFLNKPLMFENKYKLKCKTIII